MINFLLGAAVAMLMHLPHMPNPLLWETMVAILNFAPYIGALVSGAVLTVTALTTFPDIVDELAVPGTFLALTILEGQVVTPAVSGVIRVLPPR